MSKDDEGTNEVAVREDAEVAAAEERLNVGARSGLRALSAVGRAAVERHREMTATARIIEGLEWGSVKGAALSSATRYAMAEFCDATGADPLLHLHVLGGLPYLNAQYWSDRMNADPHFIRYEQVNVTAGIEDTYREQAERAIADAQTLDEIGNKDGAEEARGDAARLLAMARHAVAARADYGVPAEATAAYETEVYRYVNGAPLEAILAGEIDPQPYIKIVRECNWAGTGDRSDPIGNNDPQTTGRTRSMRRAARFAFPAIAKDEARIRKAEQQIEAEWHVIEKDENKERAALPAPGEGQAVRASGEPEASNAAGADDLPTRAPAKTAVEQSSADAFDRDDARKRFFATFRDAGISEDRKSWSARNNLPESTGDWGEKEYAHALDVLQAPTFAKVSEAAEVLGIEDLDQYAASKLGHAPDTLRDWKSVLSHLNADADSPQGSLV